MAKAFLFAFFLALQFSVCVGKQNVVYVSSSEGDDNNDGLYSESPVKTIAQGCKIGDTLLLKRGDVFYETVKISHGKLSCYGKGKKPVICGWKRIITPNWKSVGSNIWKISLEDANFNGYKVGDRYLLNNIGCLHEYDKDSIHGRKVQYKRQLNSDWDIWQTEHHKNGEVLETDFDSLYLYLHDDPNQLKLEFSVSSVAVSLNNATLENIRIEGFGFGVTGKSRTKIQNCEIDAIGGKIQVNNRYYVCYGNGIEFWITKDLSDCLIENNRISRCYDCACTIQGSETSIPTNIKFRRNVIWDCCQGWEDFFDNENHEAVYKDCVFEENLVINSGNTTGFGYTEGRTKYCHVLENNYLGNKGMIFRNNTFVGGNYFCAAKYDGAFKSNIWIENTCYIKRGEWLLRCVNKGDEIIRVPKEKGNYSSLKDATNEAIREYRQLTGDMTTKFVIESDKKIGKRIKKLKKEYAKR